MEACLNVEKEIDKVVSKFTSYGDHSRSTLSSLCEDLERHITEIKNVGECDISEAQAIILSQVVGRVKEITSRLSTEHRDLHSFVSKVGKAIDKNFPADFGCISTQPLFTGDKQKLVNEVICQHLLREGLLDVAEFMIEEGCVDLKEDYKAMFFELHRISAALKERNLRPALQWAEANRTKLRAQNSSLEFKLHRLAFIELVSSGPHQVNNAINYARTFLMPFVYQHEKSIQSLMGCLLYARIGLDKSPYADFLSHCQWAEICEIFNRDACALLGLSVDNALAVCINTGCKALPILLDFKQVLQQQVHNVWNTKEELPIEIDLEPSCHYHSIFACPILRQQSTENNPPMRLICGHVISQDALNKLTSGNKLKCPYCPVEQCPSRATHIYF